MSNLNKVMLMGNLVRDPELTVIPSGTPVTNFSIAINRKWKDEAGAEKEEVTYVDIQAWGKHAENVQKFFTKGKPIFVEGRLRLEQWDDKQTQEKRSRMRVILENWQFIGGNRDDAQGGGQNGGGYQQQPQGRPAPRPAQGQQQGNPQPRYSAPAPRGQTATRQAPSQQENLDEDVPF